MEDGSARRDRRPATPVATSGAVGTQAEPAEGTGRIPDFFLVGHPKSGTTALYEMLAQHPRVFVGLKEPRYFATELHERDYPRPGGTPKTLEQYRAWFASAAPDQLVGDISPVYLWSQSAAALIAEVDPEAKIIAILREPASFLHSLHRQWLQLNVESETDFEKALELEEERRQGRAMPANAYWPNALFYSDHVRYVEQLRRFEAHFPTEHMLVLIYDDYRRDNEATLRTVLRFLGLQEDHPVVTRMANPSVEVRAARLHALLRNLVAAQGPVSRTAKAALMALLPMRLRQRILRTTRERFVFGEPTPPREDFMLELRRRLKPEVVALSEHLDRDLVSLWGYNKL
jgi:Sulfotransferase family